jgi:hypothetical protein
MMMTLVLDDAMYAAFKEQAKERTGPGVEREVLRRLKETLEVPRNDRLVLVYGDQRRELEAQFDTTINSPADLVSKVRHLAMFKVGDVEVPLTAGQAALLGEQARFHGKDLQTYMRETAVQIVNELINRA